MTDTATPGVPDSGSPSLESKIVTAAEQSTQIVAAFSQPAAVLIQSGVAIEPVISGIIHMIVGLFHHHTKQAAKSAT